MCLQYQNLSTCKESLYKVQFSDKCAHQFLCNKQYINSYSTDWQNIVYFWWSLSWHGQYHDSYNDQPMIYILFFARHYAQYSQNLNCEIDNASLLVVLSANIQGDKFSFILAISIFCWCELEVEEEATNASWLQIFYCL